MLIFNLWHKKQNKRGQGGIRGYKTIHTFTKSIEDKIIIIIIIIIVLLLIIMTTIVILIIIKTKIINRGTQSNRGN